jgi:hypothetical protein
MSDSHKGPILLLGNGLNRLENNEFGWNNVLDQLAGKAKSKREKDIRKAKPFTLWFEELTAESNVDILKENVAKGISEYLKPGVLHEKFMALNVSHILTTNYDYNLESCAGLKRSSKNTSPENIYSLFRRSEVGGKFVWHIHGEIGNPKSIMLGHDQYVRYLYKIQNFLNSGVPNQSKERNNRPYVSRFSDKIDKMKGDTESWVDLFIERDVHIVGFGVDYTENHLWNLIYSKRKITDKFGINPTRVTYYRCSETPQSVDDEAKISILKSMQVEVIEFEEKSYALAYEACLKDLEHKIL